MGKKPTGVGPSVFIGTILVSVALTPIMHALLLSLVSQIALSLSLIEQTEELILGSLIAYPIVFIATAAALLWLVRKLWSTGDGQGTRRA